MSSANPVSANPEIPLFDLELDQSDLDAVAEVLRSGWLTLGPRTEAFEAAFAEHLGCKHVIALSSCTAALHLAYLAAGVGPGDEVIVPSFTFAATATAALYCGATPVFADIVGLEHPMLDPADVEAKITPRTKVVCIVHFAGYPGKVDELRRLCDERGIQLVEDVAHAPDARLGDRKLGTWGMAGCFSLFSNKILSVGEGGMLSTDSDEVAAFVRSRRSHAMTSGTLDRHLGRTTTYDVVGLGYNYRIDEPRAALALSRLNSLGDMIDRRRALTRRYREAFAAIPNLIVPYDETDVEQSSCYVMPVMVADPERQVPLRRALRDQGIQTSLFYPSIHEFSAYRERFPDVSLPRTELASRSELTIPLYPHMTTDDQDRVIDAITTELAGAGGLT